MLRRLKASQPERRDTNVPRPSTSAAADPWITADKQSEITAQGAHFNSLQRRRPVTFPQVVEDFFNFFFILAFSSWETESAGDFFFLASKTLPFFFIKRAGELLKSGAAAKTMFNLGLLGITERRLMGDERVN